MLETLDPKYPYVQALAPLEGMRGYKVHINKRVSLPGVYTDIFRAERAIEAYSNRPKGANKDKSK